jgi:hypothetical protein
MKKNMKKIIREKRAHIKMNIYTWCEKFTKGVCILWPQSDDWMETSQHNLQFQVQIEEEYSDWSLISCKDLYGEQKFVKQQQLTGIKDGPVRLPAVGTLKRYSKALKYEYRVKTTALVTLKRYSILSLTLYLEWYSAYSILYSGGPQ